MGSRDMSHQYCKSLAIASTLLDYTSSEITRVGKVSNYFENCSQDDLISYEDLQSTLLTKFRPRLIMLLKQLLP